MRFKIISMCALLIVIMTISVGVSSETEEKTPSKWVNLLDKELSQ